MIIRRYISDLMFSNMYVLKENGHALIIDPFERYELPEDLRPDLMIITHEHYDHISGVNRVKEEYKTPSICSEICAQRITNAKLNAARYFDAFSQLQTYGEQNPTVPVNTNYTCRADFTFENEIRFNWQGNSCLLFTLPGHSPGSIGILINNQYFFSGDSLFYDREIELRFPGGSKDDWNEISLKKLEHIPDDVIVFPGHQENFRMKERRQK